MSNARRDVLATPAEVVPPAPGELELLTLHRAKGAEYDAVWLPGLGPYYSDKTFFPWDLDAVEIWDQEAHLAEQAVMAAAHVPGIVVGDTLFARRQLVAERMRLLYVGVTRAEKELHLSSYARGGKDPEQAQIQAMIALCRRRTP